MNTSVETRKEELKNEMNNLFESFKGSAVSLMAICPEWKVADVDCGSRRSFILLTLGSNEHCTIEIRYAKECGRWQKEEFSTNIAAMGSFDMLDADANANYYIAVGSLLSKKEMLSQLKEKMVEFTERAYELIKEYNKLDEED